MDWMIAMMHPEDWKKRISVCIHKWENRNLPFRHWVYLVLRNRCHLGLTVKEAKDLTIRITGKEGIFRDMDVYLVDHALNKTHNLKEGDYTFNQTTTGDFPNRFTLQFSKNALDVDKIIEGSEFSVFNSGEGFRINASKVVKEVKVYDMLGRTIINSKPNQQSFYLNAGNLKTGAVLIFEVKLENGTILNKKAIKM